MKVLQGYYQDTARVLPGYCLVTAKILREVVEITLQRRILSVDA